MRWPRFLRPHLYRNTALGLFREQINHIVAVMSTNDPIPTLMQRNLCQNLYS